MTGWEQLGPAFEMIRNSDMASGRMDERAPLLIHKWFPGGHLYFYVAYPLKMRLIGLGSLNDLHKFHWLKAKYGKVESGSDAYYITPSNNFQDPAEIYQNLFSTIDKPVVIRQLRGGKVARYWFVYRLRCAGS